MTACPNVFYDPCSCCDPSYSQIRRDPCFPLLRHRIQPDLEVAWELLCNEFYLDRARLQRDTTLAILAALEVPETVSSMVVDTTPVTPPSNRPSVLLNVLLGLVVIVGLVNLGLRIGLDFRNTHA